MKTLTILCAFVAATVGCGPNKKTEDRISKLEQEDRRGIEEMRSLENLVDKQQMVLEAEHVFSSNIMAEIKELRRDVDLNFRELDAIHTMLESRQTNRLQTLPIGQRPPDNPYKVGIPPIVYNQIAADAIKKYPGNYEMQQYEIKNQVQAYRELRR